MEAEDKKVHIFSSLPRWEILDIWTKKAIGSVLIVSGLFVIRTFQEQKMGRRCSMAEFGRKNSKNNNKKVDVIALIFLESEGGKIN